MIDTKRWYMDTEYIIRKTVNINPKIVYKFVLHQVESERFRGLAVLCF
ncbi:MAG: hypothetical protein QXG00_08575 [Candidatus Woesearchaeota archaeon]